MQRIVRNTFHQYIPEKFSAETVVNPARIFELNKAEIKEGNVVYLCEREIRAKDNFALMYAKQKSEELNLPLIIIHPEQTFEFEQKRKFISSQIFQAQNAFYQSGFDFRIIGKFDTEILDEIKTAVLVIDFNPILNRDYLKNSDFKIYEIDGHNIVPARFVSDKAEFGAVTLRRKIYYNLYPFMTEFENSNVSKVEADLVLEDFIKNKLPCYAEFKNDPSKNFVSGLSKYLNLGFLSGQRIAIEVIKSNADNRNKETFLEELVVRKELADNFCLYARNFKDFSDIPSWAKISLDNHKHDIRLYTYSLADFEQAKTHDKLWNCAQNQLLREGRIHGYLRMYWAKKILEWTVSPKEALKIAQNLNDKYAFDSPSANGYAGILWAVGALHDRAFSDYAVTGKIRRMTYNSIKKKFDLTEFMRKYS